MKNIQKITLIGAGVMGPGIAQIMAMAGAEVVMYDIAAEALDRAKITYRNNLDTFADEGLIAQDRIQGLFGKVSYEADLEKALAGTDMVVEAVVEKKPVKETVYAELDRLLPEGVIIASNTSALNIFEIMPERRLPDTLIAHWYAPANVIPLVEVVGSDKTRPEAVDAVMELLRRGGKTPVRMHKFIRGYIVNRLQQCLNQEVFYLLDNDYCTPEDIDLAVKTSFIPRAMVLGLCKRIDFGGVDMTANNFRNRSYTMPAPTDMPKTLGKLVDAGNLGIKTGKGFYDYTGKNIEELKDKRDKQLFSAFALEKKFMDDPV